jgi:transposase
MLETINPRAAAADVGSESIHVSIAGAKPVVFGTVTRELQRLRDYLLGEQVDTIAMEFTGVYWMPLFEILEKTSIKVCLYNGAQIKALPGRKSDVADSQWASTLHSHGLIRSGFVPAGEIRKLRDYMRLRGNHLSQASSHVLQMQKALELMNLKIHDVISDITGASGQRLLKAILDGVRDPEVLVQCCDERILDKKEQRLRDSLEGTWAEQHLFALQQAWEAWEFCQRQISRCDLQIQKVLVEMASKASAAPESGDGGESGDSKEGGGKRKRMGKNAPKILELDTLLQSILGGRAPAKLPGLTQYSVLQLVSEIGTDLSAFPSEKHFTSWLGLAPGQRQSGKRRRNQSRKGARAGQIFRNVAQTVGRSVKMGLGVFYRRIRSLRGGLVACKALGRKLAELYYRVMTKGLKFVEEGLEKAEQQYQEQARARLERQARKMGMRLEPLPS